MTFDPPPIQEKTSIANGLFPQTWIKWFQDLYSRINDLEAAMGQTGAFGETIVAEQTPIFQASAQYGIGGKLETFESSSGSASSANSLFICQTGTSVGGYGVIRSARPIVYKAGQGGYAKFTSMFTTGVASSLQAAGLFNLTDGFLFGYDGTTFGIIRQYFGSAEIRRLTITGAATGSESATITINSVAYTVPLVAGTVQSVAHQITAYFEANATASAAWFFSHIDDTVVICSKSAATASGTYSMSSASAAGSFTQLNAGAAKSTETIAQASWNCNKATWLDPTKLNVFKIQYQYLGAGAVDFFIENPADGSFIKVHQIKYANSHTTPSVGNPSFKVGWISASLGSTTNLTVSGASCEAGVQGKYNITEEPRGIESTKASIGSTATNLVTIKNRIEFNNRPNLSTVFPKSIIGFTDSTKGAVIEIWKAADVAGTTTHQYVDEDTSIVVYDTSGTTVTNGKLLQAFLVTSGGSSPFIFPDHYQTYLLPNEYLVISARVVSGAASSVTVAVNWQEDI